MKDKKKLSRKKKQEKNKFIHKAISIRLSVDFSEENCRPGECKIMRSNCQKKNF